MVKVTFINVLLLPQNETKYHNKSRYVLLKLVHRLFEGLIIKFGGPTRKTSLGKQENTVNVCFTETERNSPKKI